MSDRRVARAWMACLQLTLLPAALTPCAVSAGDVLTQQYSNARIGAVLDETRLTAASVGSGNFGRLWTLYTDGQVVAQPLYVRGLAVDTSANTNIPIVRGTFNAVVVATMHNTVYVYDADKENSGPEGRTAPLWATWLGKPRPGSKEIDMWSTNDPEWGILSTPVISSDKSTLYVVAWHDDAAEGLRFRLHALDMKNGLHRRPPAPVGVASTDPTQPCRPQSPFNPCRHKQRAALLLQDGLIYVGFGGDGNRGALFAFDSETLAERAFWNPTPTGGDGGIWQSGQGPAADAQGNVYLMTGNGSFDEGQNPRNFGNSFVKLRFENGAIKVTDYFTPCNYRFLNSLDLDLGSAGPVLLPETPARIVSGGKEGTLYLLSRDNMGKFASTPTAQGCRNDHAVQEVRAFPIHNEGGQDHWGNIHGSPVYWRGPDKGRVYAWGENSPLKAFLFDNGQLENVAHPKESAYRPPVGMPGGMLAVSANGSQAGTGIVWATVPLDGDANRERGVTGILLALDAQDVSHTLWTSEQNAQRDRLGLFAKFAPPTVADGKVFVATYGDREPRQIHPPDRQPTQFPANYHVAVYGALAPPEPMKPVVNQDRDDVAVIRAATESLTLDLGRCRPIDAASIDCTDAVAQAAGAPSFHRVVLATDAAAAGCALLRVVTASKDTGLANATGIGFWSSQVVGGNQAAENAGRFIAKGELKSIGTATLRNGAPATLSEFVGVANCVAAGAGRVERLFKPYMQFEGTADGRIYRNWDLAENYRITPAITEFDRSGDVLQR